MTIDRVDITLLVNNSADTGLEAEHGLAMWIETPDHRLLFDTGQGPALAANADRLGIDLAQAHTLFLSHGHYDHTGGVAHVLKSNTGIEVFCHPCGVQPRYSILYDAAKPIHMPQESMAAMDKLSDRRMHWVSGPVQLNDDIGITGPVPRKSSFEDVEGPFYLDPYGRRKDTIQDDTAMWINTPKGLLVLVGCAHAGLINTLHYVRDLSGVPTIRAVVGGFHLTGTTPERIDRTVDELVALDPAAIVTCHCTGEKATAAFKTALNNRVSKGLAGMQLHFRP